MNVHLEGHGRSVALGDFSYTVRLGHIDASTPSPEDLMVSSESSGEVASAHVMSVGPIETAASRPGGPVRDAGVMHVRAGPDGDWHVRVRDFRFPWAQGMLVRVPPDEHPGDMLPVYIAPSLGDEMITLYGAFDSPPPFEEFVAAGQEVLRHEEVDGVLELELAYEHDGQQWYQYCFWVRFAGSTLVVKAQALESSSEELVEVAKAVCMGLRAD